MQLRLESKVFTEIMEMVESRYLNDLPLHRFPSARSIEYDPEGSSIFIVEANVFEKMSAVEIQNIFRHRHILVLNTPQSQLSFDREGLSTLAPLKKKVVFQGKFF